jgi:hypothetical protein
MTTPTRKEGDFSLADRACTLCLFPLVGRKIVEFPDGRIYHEDCHKLVEQEEQQAQKSGNCPKCGIERCHICQGCHIWGCANQVTMDMECFKRTEWGFLRKKPMSIRPEHEQQMMAGMFDTQDARPRFLDLYYRHSKSCTLHQLSEMSALPYEIVMHATIDWPIPYTSACKLLATLNALTGSHYHLEDTRILTIKKEK